MILNKKEREIKMTRRYCNFSFTINNWTEEDYEALKEIDCQYMIIGKEGKDKTPHLQGYIQFNRTKNKTLTAVRKKIKRGHVEEAKHTANINRNYCMKEGDYEEFGTIKHQGRRADLDHIRQLAVDEGMRGVTKVASSADIVLAEKFLSHHEQPRNWKPNVFWIYGPTGVGKSRLARHIFQGTTDIDHPDIFVLHPVLSTEDTDPYTKSDPSKWWNGYDAHPNVIIDDFRPSWWTFTYLLSLLDRYECRVEIKGNVRQFKPKNIVVTSLKSPEEYYAKRSKYITTSNNEPHEPHEQLLRRIDELIELDYYIENEKRKRNKAKFVNRKLIQSDSDEDIFERTEKRGVIDFTKADELYKNLFD